MVATLYLNKYGHLHLFKGRLKLRTTGVNAYNHQKEESDVYIQDPSAVESILESLPPKKRQNLDAGFTCIADIDPLYFPDNG